MKTATSTSHATGTHLPLCWKRAGFAGFTFFLLKGVVWLIAPGLLYLLG